MARILITGSADGLGLELARQLTRQGREVVVHGRTGARASEAARAAGAHDAVHGDLSSVAETVALAEQANALAPFDAVVHNAGVGYRDRHRVTADGVEHVFAVNVLAAYILTALVPAPTLIYLSSGLHRQGDPDLDDLAWERRRWDAMQAYCDSKLLDVVLAFAVARRWPEVTAAAVEPGWIATKMGGRGAPGTLDEGVQTQLYLLSGDGAARPSGRLYSRSRAIDANPRAADPELQDRLRTVCEQVSGVALPATAPASA